MNLRNGPEINWGGLVHPSPPRGRASGREAVYSAGNKVRQRIIVLRYPALDRYLWQDYTHIRDIDLYNKQITAPFYLSIGKLQK